MLQPSSNEASNNVLAASYRLKKHLTNTKLVACKAIDELLDNKVFFKLDSMQKTGSFKIRGVMNHLLALKNSGQLPEQIVTYSTGNHAIAVAYAAKLLGIKARLYLPTNVISYKQKIISLYEAEVITVATRQEAEKGAIKDGDKGFYLLPPSDDEYVIAGAGTLCFEALEYFHNNNMPMPGAIFASCGGGGLLAGTYLAKQIFDTSCKVIGCEPELAADAYKSLQQGEIFRFDESPTTIADGLRALSIAPRIFEYLKKLDDFITVKEEEISHFTHLLNENLHINSEPSAAISLAAAAKWLQEKNIRGSNILVLISGGNVAPPIGVKKTALAAAI